MSKIQFDNDNMDEVRLNEDVNMVVFHSIEINDCFSIGDTIQYLSLIVD